MSSNTETSPLPPPWQSREDLEEKQPEMPFRGGFGKSCRVVRRVPSHTASQAASAQGTALPRCCCQGGHQQFLSRWQGRGLSTTGPQGAGGEYGRAWQDRTEISHQLPPCQCLQLSQGKAERMPSGILGQASPAKQRGPFKEEGATSGCT